MDAGRPSRVDDPLFRFVDVICCFDGEHGVNRMIVSADKAVDGAPPVWTLMVRGDGCHHDQDGEHLMSISTEHRDHRC
jgi:hypothetical protein